MKIQTKRLSKNTYLTVLSVIMVLVTMIGTSYGFLMKTNEDETSYTTGVLQIELVTTGDGYGETINLSNTVPTTDEEGMNLTPYKFIIKNTGNLNYQFDLKLVLDEEKMTEDGCADNTISFSNVKVQVNDEKPVLLSDLTDSVLISNSVLNAGKSMEVSIRIWLDENTTNAAIGKHFHALLATDGYAIETEASSDVVLSNHITSLYTNATKTGVVNNSITYEYAKDISMMTDIGGNIRYYGADPDNYIYFNCDNYSNQTSDTCEKWRIIGVFDGKVKIIRSAGIGNYSWDTSDGTNDDQGINQWGESTYTDGSVYEGADLMRLLNPGYEEESINNSLYYNSGSGKCYNNMENEYTTCDFTNTGLKNDETRNLISDTLYYLGAYYDSNIYSDEMYEYERGELNYGSSSDSVNRTTTWTGKIALPYPSDYGYAGNFEYCTQTLSNYNFTADSGNCLNLNWMAIDITGGTTAAYLWFLTPNSSSAFSTWHSHEAVESFRTYYVGNIAPVLHLNADVIVDTSKGTGDVDVPYQIVIS